MKSWFDPLIIRIYILLLLGALSLNVVFAVIHSQSEEFTRREIILSDLKKELTLRSRGFNDWLVTQGQKLRMIEGFLDQDLVEIGKNLKRLENSTPQFRNIYLLSPNQNLVLTTDSQDPVTRWSKEEWIKESLSGFSQSGVSVDAGSGVPRIRIAVPLRDHFLKLIYFAVADLELSEASVQFSRQLGSQDFAYSVVPGRFWLFRPKSITELPVFQDPDYIDLALSGDSFSGTYKNLRDFNVAGIYYFDSSLQVAFFMERLYKPWTWTDCLLQVIPELLGSLILITLGLLLAKHWFRPLNTWRTLIISPVGKVKLGEDLPKLGSLLKDFDKEMRSALSSRDDLIQHKRNERDKLREILDFSQDLLIEISSEGTITYLSEGGLLALGFVLDDLIHKPLDYFVEEMKPMHLKLPLILHAPSGHRFYAWIQMKTGEKKLLETVVSHKNSKNPEEVRHFLSVRDVTQRFSSGETARHQKKMESLFNFSAGVVHDFSNLLAGVSGKIALAIMEAEKGVVDTESLNQAQSLIMNARSLTDDLVSMGAGGVYDLQGIDAYPVLNSSLDGLRKEGVPVFLNLLPQAPQIRADKRKLELIFQEVGDNALVFAGPSKPLRVSSNIVSLPVDATEGKVQNYLRISFLDQGPGIPVEEMERIYDPYYTTIPGRKGLGLTVAYSLLSRMGGFMEIESELGKGTEVRLFFLTAD